MSRYICRVSGQRRPWLVRVIERDVVVATAAGLVAGLLAGAFAFWVGSSRGLGSIELAALVELGSTLVAFGLLVAAAFTALWRDDVRAAALLLAAVLGGWLGTQAAFYALPGDTTDGTLLVAVESSAPEEGEPATRATCRWDRASGRVVEVYSRQPASVGTAALAVPNAPVVPPTTPSGPFLALHVDVLIQLPSGHGAGSARFDVIAPFSTTAVLRLEGTAEPRLDEPSGRSGEITIAARSRQELDARGVDDTALELLEAALARLGSRPLSVSWECPQLP